MEWDPGKLSPMENSSLVPKMAGWWEEEMSSVTQELRVGKDIPLANGQMHHGALPWVRTARPLKPIQPGLLGGTVCVYVCVCECVSE